MLQYSQEYICVGDSFLMKLNLVGLPTVLQANNLQL